MKAIEINPEYFTFKNALDFVDRESPVSSDSDKKELAQKLLKIAIEQNEYFPRAWTISEYWG